MTPKNRDRYVDFLRALAACMVVSGHWLALMITFEDGSLGGQHILQFLPWTQWFTWGFQVMGMFFVVGGYANTASWDSARRRGEAYDTWVRGRAVRLLRPTTVFLAVGTLAAVGARLAGQDPDLVRQGAWLVSIAVWFLAVYVVVVGCVPAVVAAQRRWGLWFPAALTVVAGAFDALRLGTMEQELAVPNFLLVWLIIHQLGIAWREGAWARSRARPWWLLLGGSGALILFTTVGPYSVSMVAVPDAPVQNTSPPTLALLALVIAQTGLALLLAPRIRRWLRHRVVWRAVIVLNGVIMSLFLWHMVAALGAALALYPTGMMPQPVLGSPEWWLLRVPWLLACGVVMVGLVLVFARFERPQQARRGPARRGLPVPLDRVPAHAWVLVGTGAVCAGIFQITIAGFQGRGPVGIPAAALLTYAAGLGAFALSGRAPLPAGARGESD